jgi:glucosamine-6-phosphate deaminase
MEVVILPTPDDVARAGAAIVAHVVRGNPTAVLGLATGATQEPVHAELARMHREQALDFGQVTTFNLDEYVGLGPDHPGSFHRAMREHLFSQVNLDPARTHVPDGIAADLATTCAEYELAIRRAGGIDLQILGIGRDGHIGFNEPSSSLASRTRLKTLTAATLATVAPRLAGAVPRHVLTMGIATILEARRCLLLAHGNAKAAAVALAVEGAITARVPASALQLHPRTTVIVDEDAARDLALADYYRDVFRGKPTFQRDADGL